LSALLSLPDKKEILSLISLCERILVLILVTMSPSLYASIIFNVKLVRKILSMRHGSQNIPVNNRPMPAVSSSPREMTEDSSSLPALSSIV
jgi:hypothetical protein